ncbi:MAG: EAL domain-containing protein [Nitrosomonadales bacterium]|nr:EAL domain-containing protein [Nitrosomonadales bacterium]
METRFRNLPIGKKLRMINLLIVSLITLLTISSMSFLLYGSLRDNYRQDAITLSAMLAQSVNPALQSRDSKAARRALNSLRTVNDVLHAEIYDQAGHLIASYTRDDNDFGAPQNFDPSQYEKAAPFGSIALDHVAPVWGPLPDKKQLGIITIRMDLVNAYRHLAQQILAILLVGLLSFTLIGILLTRLQKSITLPLLSLTEAMHKVSRDGDFSVRATTGSQDEIGVLANGFNQMLDELSKREESLHQELQERRRIEERLSEIAHFDSVSNLPNRNSFNSQIDRALIDYKYDHEKFALMFLDLDNFKYVNDTFGHHAGDLLLARVAERLRGSLRQEDYIARLGGDEFAVIMRDFTGAAQISTVSRKILAALQQPFFLEGHEAFIGASIGITICPDNGEDRETLQRQADSAMYQAKNLGKNTFEFYQADLSLAHKNRINIETQLRRSLENHEIVVYYQPIVEIQTGSIAGFEALARWIKQDGTIMRPDDFIPLAEEIGLINDIGSHLIKSSAIQTASWVNRFGQTFTAVNFSSRQFKQNDLANDVLKALENAGLKPCYFEIEITESILMNNSSDSMNLLGLLLEQGMGIAIDDFGTGYSSLSYLTSFPISKIKIDKSFVAKLPGDKNALAVVTAIIGLAKSLNLKVVAEGIETAEQLACLAKLGCQYGQGYLFGNPLPAEDATKLLELRSTQPALSPSIA